MKSIGNKDMSIQMDIVRIKEDDTPYWHKIVDGPKQVHTVYYPTVSDEGKVVKAVIPVASPWKNIFTPLAEADIAIKKAAIFERSGRTEEATEAAKKVRSELSASSTFHCLILDKKDDVPVIKHAEYKYSVYRKLLELEKAPAVDDRGNKDETKLRYGLLFMFWVEIMRGRKGESKNVAYDTEYTVKALDKFLGKWENKIPRMFLNASQTVNADGTITLTTPTASKSLPVVDLGMFTEEEFQALLNFNGSIAEMTVPFTDEQALEKLESYPIKLDATDDKGNYLLPDWQQIRERLEEKHISLPFQYEKKALPPRKPEPEPETVEPEVKGTKKSTPKNDFDELFGDEEKKDEEPKKRGRPSSKKEDFNFDDAEDVEAKELDDPLASLLT